MGYEANYAGTSFVAPPEKQIGKLKYGRDFMNIQGDRTQEARSLACAWDDEGVPADKWLHHREGHLQGLPDDARAGGVDLEAHRRQEVARLLVRRLVVERAVPAHAERSLLPGEKDIGARRHHRGDRSRHRRSGIAARGRSTTSATTSSSPARCSTKCKGGKVTGMLKDVAYQASTPRVLEQHGHDRRRSRATGSADRSVTARVSRGRSNSVSHGCVPARFKRREHRQHGRALRPRSLFTSRALLLTRSSRRRRSATVLGFARPTRRASSLERLERQHALRRRRDHDVRRHDRHRR